MEKELKLRAALRTQFTKKTKNFEALMASTIQPENIPEVTAMFKFIKEIVLELDTVDREIRNKMLNSDSLEEEKLEQEMDGTEKYKTKWLFIETKYEQLIKKYTVVLPKNQSTNKIKLPKLEIPQFNGELKAWLPFWSQFKKIHDDSNLECEDKFMYLIQAIPANTEARQLVDSYPISRENYQKCVEHLQSRFAREELLIQVYVRELLTLVLQKGKLELCNLFDKLSANLRALETLGVTDKHAAFLLPLVESTIPQDILIAWERMGEHDAKMEVELTNLLTFLQKEVQSEQRIKIAQDSFNTHLEPPPKPEVPTAANLLTNAKKSTEVACVWCKKTNHVSMECFKVHKMTLDQRKEHLKKEKACTNCLRPGHYFKNCKAFVKCLICSKRHHTVLCPEQKSTSSVTPETTSMSTSANRGTTYLQTVLVEIQNEEKSVQVRALYDSGSQHTYLKEEIAKKLQLKPTGTQTLSHCLFGGVTTNSTNHKVYDVTVRNLDKTFQFNLEALSQNQICNNIPKVNLTNNTKLSNILCKHNVTLTDINSNTNEIGLLIGADFSGFLMTGDIIQLENGLVAVKTKLGWTVQGQQVGVNVNSDFTTSLFSANKKNDLTGYWSLETLGIRDPSEVKSKTEAAAEVMSSFQESIKTDSNGRYEVKLPFKINHQDLLDNYVHAKQRLISMTQKLKCSGRFQDYDDIFNEWLSLGIIEKVEHSEQNSGHYLPHRAVIKESSLTSVVRPVFDASAKDKNGLSLNNCLEKGINMIDLIPNLIINFRTGKIGITADIQKAFLQISLSPDDRDFLKFLWWENESQQNIVTYRHCRVVFGLTTSPFLLAATLQHHLNKISDPCAELLKKSWYVDNCITSLDTEQETFDFIEKSKEIMSAAKFNLRMWVTAPLKINESGKQVISVLGLNWDTQTDELYCNFTNMPIYDKLVLITKRELLSLIQKVFDPIGYTSPAMLTPKLMLQETWVLNLGWDDKLPEDLFKKFKDWYKYFEYFNRCRVPRRLSIHIIKTGAVSLHLFCDASKNGYGACVFLRVEKDCKVSVQLISAKARVTPPQKITIPRLELMAALIGSRLLSQIKENVRFTNYTEYCWTDSGVTLCWIKRELPLNNFVGNRVKEIRQNSDVRNWYHISGEDNWADLASRGCDAKTLYECCWWQGPAWLYLEPNKWPRSELVVDEREVYLETKKTVCNTLISNNEDLLQKIESYFSKYTKVIRMTAWILRFLYNSKNRNNKLKGEISYSEYNNAEKTIIKLIQSVNSDFINKNINLTQYCDEEGIIRVKTKLLLSSDLPELIKSPYLLPAKNPIVMMMVRHRHTQLQHAGTHQLIADIRTKFWIIGIRRLVKQIISSCVICKRYKSSPIQAPNAPLPLDRITCNAAFQTTGVDLAGPLYLRDGEKCWIVLFTCAVYRAVHLELTRSLSTEAFIMSMRRFIARRGRVNMFMSDQGTNFLGTKNLLSSLDWEEVQRQSTVRHIAWKMNAPSAAWWGGYWERLIRIMKDLLKRILGKATVTFDELQTIICDCEATMNGRPLTYVCDDKGDGLEPLTPTYFIQPIPNSEVPDLDVLDATSLNSRVQYLQTLREQFRQRFKSEYLSFLVQKGKEKKDSLAVGDIVLIETEDKRIRWPLGLVLELIAGRDGIERTVRVKTSTGVKVRPIQRLYKLEVSANTFRPQPRETPTAPSEREEDTIPSVSNIPPQTTRSGRKINLPSKYKLYV